MREIIITGASRGIGAALARALGPDQRLVLVARDLARLEQLRTEIDPDGGRVRVLRTDLSSLAAAGMAGDRLSGEVEGATLVHNAGVWPARRTLTAQGLETSFVVNHLAPLALQAPLLARGKLARILVVSAGLIAKGRFDRERTPTGDDFSALRTYCDTKLCFAVAMREVAERDRDVDVLVLHPGVVRTDLGARPGVVGALLALAKRGWESPERCAARLVRVLGRTRWSAPGEAPFWFEETPTPWPAAACDRSLRSAVWDTSTRLLVSHHVPGAGNVAAG
jgi:NAD(P)-dependent dehydrogenase (short-subunit alcohol dehydrogenase family)